MLLMASSFFFSSLTCFVPFFSVHKTMLEHGNIGVGVSTRGKETKSQVIVKHKHTYTNGKDEWKQSPTEILLMSTR